MVPLRRVAWIRGAILLLGLGAIGLTFPREGSPQASIVPNVPEAPRVRVAALVEASNAVEVGFAGEVEAGRQAMLAFSLPGRIAARVIELGDRVGSQAPLLVLDRRDLRQTAQAAEATVQRFEAQLDHGTSMHRRMQELSVADAAPMTALEDAELQERVARAAREEARATLARAQKAMHDGILRAPFDGVITQLAVEVGEHVGPGQVLVAVADDASLKLEVEIPETWLGTVSPGNAVVVALPLVGRRVQGIVRSVGEATRDGGLFPVVVDLPKEGLKAGMTAELCLSRSHGSGFSVPIEAVIGGVAGGPQVFVVDGDERVRPVDVRVMGVTGPDAVIEGSLATGDRVITHGHVGLFEGKQVEVAT